MELNEHGFLEELLTLRRENCEIPEELNEHFSNNWSNFDYFDQTNTNYLPFDQNPNNNNNYFFNESFYSLPCEFSAAGQSADSSYNTFDTTTRFGIQDGTQISHMEEEELSILADEIHNLEVQANCKVEPNQSPDIPVFNVGLEEPKCGRAKKLQGQPSKNLMAERRRRKRLNDRLSMLRSIVPKISKMDRTAILGDAIDYMKELLEKISNLQRDIEVGNSSQIDMMGIFKDVKPNEFLVRNSPKFEVERRNSDTRVEICCAGKQGLLLSTVDTLEALGLEIEQCVISCFNDFAMQASCSEGRGISTEEIKQALFRNAGYGGRCL